MSDDLHAEIDALAERIESTIQQNRALIDSLPDYDDRRGKGTTKLRRVMPE